MATSQKSRTKEWLVQSPEQVGNALAHVIALEGGRETILGQAWLAAPGRLITCGHVIERYINNPSQIILRFPSSGNRYPVERIGLHPSFVRQPDQLVKFDVALLESRLHPPESTTSPLPFSYGQEIKSNQTLWAIRYPAHLGQLSAAPRPLTQDGRFLGPLRVHDQFHLLHDLPLSPGDSGAPISDGSTIVAVHCGDTATLPGLGLPTTSIRLALWVDALRELGISETAGYQPSARSWIFPALLSFVISGALAAFGLNMYFSQQAQKTWNWNGSKIPGVRIGFNSPIHGYKYQEQVKISIKPEGTCLVYLFQIDKQDQVCILYPQKEYTASLKKDEEPIITFYGNQKLVASPDADPMYLVVIDGLAPDAATLASEVLKPEDYPPGDREGRPLVVKGNELLGRIRDLIRTDGEKVSMAEFIGPHSINGPNSPNSGPAPSGVQSSATSPSIIGNQ